MNSSSTRYVPPGHVPFLTLRSSAKETMRWPAASTAPQSVFSPRSCLAQAWARRATGPCTLCRSRRGGCTNSMYKHCSSDFLRTNLEEQQNIVSKKKLVQSAVSRRVGTLRFARRSPRLQVKCENARSTDCSGTTQARSRRRGRCSHSRYIVPWPTGPLRKPALSVRLRTARG